MEAVKKYWFWGILISILSIFAMSHNANAINVNFENYEFLSTSSSPNIYCKSADGQVLTSNPCNFNATQNTRLQIQDIRTNLANGYELQQGDIIEFYVSFYTRLNNNINGGLPGLQTYNPNNYPNIINLSAEIVDDFHAYNWSVSVNSSLGFGDQITGFRSQDKFYRTYKITQYVATAGYYNIGLHTDAYLIDWYQVTDGATLMAIHDLSFYRYSESKENKEVEEKTQGAVDDSQAAGGSSSSDAQSGTTGLLNAITGAVNVITAARPTNCKINGNMGNLDMGQIDLCANPVPTFIQTIGSLLLILICVPLAISLFNRFIAIFRSFQS